MDKLYSYKMSHDNRFAPNPCHGVLTLATCKPHLRLKVKAGDWIAGWTSMSIKKHSTPIGQEKLVYLANVTEKLSFKEYWDRYPVKRILICAGNTSLFAMNFTISEAQRLILHWKFPFKEELVRKFPKGRVRLAPSQKVRRHSLTLYAGM